MIFRQFSVFVGVGVLSALVDVGTMLGLTFLGVHYGLAASVGFAVGLVVNYIFHARVTFRAATSVGTAGRFGVIVLLNYIITIGFVFSFQHLFGIPLVGKLLSLPVVAINGYFWSRCWVFK